MTRRFHRIAHEENSAASAYTINNITRVGATHGTLQVLFHGTRKSFMDVREDSIGRHEVEAGFRRMVRWAELRRVGC